MLTRLLFSLPLLAVLGCGKDSDTAAEQTRADTILTLDGDAVSGREVYVANNCNSCHGADGTGGTAPGFTSFIPTLSAEQIVQTVLGGVGDAMPPYENEVSDQDAADLLSYLLETFDP